MTQSPKRTTSTPDPREPNLLGIALLSVIALAIAWHISLLALVLTTLLVAWGLARTLTNAWWRQRSRAFGRELEGRALSAMRRFGNLLGVPVETNVPVPGIGDADAIIGRVPMIIEIKSFRRWNPSEPRCADTIAQVERLKERLRIDRALIWLPQGDLSLLQSLGLIDGLPKGTRLVAGAAWRPILKAVSVWQRPQNPPLDVQSRQ